MAHRDFDDYTVHPCAAPEGSRFTACLAVAPRTGHGFPVYFAVCENRSFRNRASAEQGAADALAAVLSLETDGTPIFPDAYTGFDDDGHGIAGAPPV